MTKTNVERIYCADLMHGGVAVLMCAVDTVVGLLLAKAEQEPGYKLNLEIDAFTFEDWGRDPAPVVAALRRALQEGRADLVNGCYTQPMSEGLGLESNIRQLQWGKRLAQQVLGYDIQTYQIQEHAYHTALPQILRQLGYQYLVLRTRWPIWGQHKTYPLESFFWEGPDGTRIPTIPAYNFMHFGYVPNEIPKVDLWIERGGTAKRGLPLEEQDIQRWLREAGEEGIARPLASRAPDLINGKVLTDETIHKIAHDPRLTFTTITDYARMVAPTTKAVIAIPPDDMDTTLPFGLLGDVVFIGCKRVENLLLTAEKLATAAYLISGRRVCNSEDMNRFGGQNYEDDLHFAWQRLMLAQQHDIWVCGPASTFGHSLADKGMRWLKEAEEVGEEIVQESLCQFLLATDTTPPVEGTLPILVCNPLSWSRTTVAQAEVTFNIGEFHAVAILDPRGKPVPFQTVEQEHYEDGSLARVVVAILAEDLPGIGYRTYFLANATPVAVSTALRAEATHASNGLIDVTLSPQGISALAFQTATGHSVDIVPAGQVAGYLVGLQGDIEHWLDTRASEARLELVENGPVYARYKVSGATEAFSYETLFTVRAGSSCVEVEEIVNFPHFTYIGHRTPDTETQREESPGGAVFAGGGWRRDVFIEKDKLRAVLPLAVQDGQTHRNVVYVPSETQRDVFLAYDWADLSDSDKGAALINTGNCRYYYDREQQALSLVLGFSGTFMYTTAQDFHRMRGSYHYSYTIAPHGPYDAAWNNRRAAEANNPLLTLGTRRWRNTGRRRQREALPSEGALVTLEAATGIVSTLLTEQGQLYLRLVEDAGQTSTARLRLMRPLRRAQIVDLLGHEQEELPVHDGAVELTLAPFKIVTLRIEV